MTAYRDIYVINCTSSLAVEAGDTAYFGPFDLGRYINNGDLSAGVSLSGSGRVDIGYELSHVTSPTDFILPTTASNIFTDFSATSGTASNGQDIREFQPELGRFIRFFVTETTSSDPVVLSFWLTMI